MRTVAYRLDPKNGLGNSAKIGTEVVGESGQSSPSKAYDIGPLVVWIGFRIEDYVVNCESVLCSTRDYSGRQVVLFNPDIERDNVGTGNAVLCVT
jgi:hypothetical protein